MIEFFNNPIMVVKCMEWIKIYEHYGLIAQSTILKSCLDDVSELVVQT